MITGNGSHTTSVSGWLMVRVAIGVYSSDTGGFWCSFMVHYWGSWCATCQNGGWSCSIMVENVWNMFKLMQSGEGWWITCNDLWISFCAWWLMVSVSECLINGRGLYLVATRNPQRWYTYWFIVLANVHNRNHFLFEGNEWEGSGKLCVESWEAWWVIEKKSKKLFGQKLIIKYALMHKQSS